MYVAWCIWSFVLATRPANFMVVDPRSGRAVDVCAANRDEAALAGARELTSLADMTELDVLELEVLVFALPAERSGPAPVAYHPRENHAALTL